MTTKHPLADSGNYSDQLKAAIESRIPIASASATGAIRKQLRGDLDAILGMALRKNPEERYATAAALRDDLIHYLNHEPVNARRGAALYKALKFVQRHRLGMAATALVAFGLCAAFVIANSERERALALAAQNAGVTEFLDKTITEAAGSDGPVTVSDMVARGEQLILADKSSSHESQAAVLFMFSSYRDTVGDHDKAIQMLDRGLALLQDSQDYELRAQLTCGRAVVMVQTGQPDAADHLIEQQLESSRVRSSGRAECLFYRSLVALYRDDPDDALRYATDALALLRSTRPVSKTREAHYMTTLAEVSKRRAAIVKALMPMHGYCECMRSSDSNAERRQWPYKTTWRWPTCRLAYPGGRCPLWRGSLARCQDAATRGLLRCSCSIVLRRSSSSVATPKRWRHTKPA